MKAIRFTLFSLFILALVSACSSRKTTESSQQGEESVSMATEKPESLVIEYKRTPCFGTCPHFDLEVYSTGRAVYTGKNFVDNIGVFTGSWTLKEIDKVLKTAEEIDYFSMNQVYDNRMVTDLPSTSTKLASGDTLKSVMNRYQGPAELQQLYEVLDGIIEKTNWEAAGQ